MLFDVTNVLLHDCRPVAWLTNGVYLGPTPLLAQFSLF